MSEIIKTEMLPGATLCQGKYVIEKKIGSGGFGITYLARHAALGKLYAIKEFFLNGYNVRNTNTNHVGLQGIETRDFDKYRQRFINEAKTLAGLNHAGIVKVLDIFDENGTSYMVMPFVQGTTLQSMVENHGPMNCDIAVNYIVQICDALSYIHSKNILHRDVTPDNVIVTAEQKTVLIDFGSARKFANDKTQRHTTILKQGYAPIEQYSATSRKGAYTDLYSLGAVFYYLLTGERPMDATERTATRMTEPIELNKNVPPQINAVIMKAMEMDSAARYQSADEVTRDIMSGNAPIRPASQKLQTAESVQQAPEQTTNSGQRTAQRSSPAASKGRLVNVVAIVMAIVAVASVVLIALWRPWTDVSKPALHEHGEQPAAVSPMVQVASLTLASCDSVMTLLAHDPADPVALYAIATKAYNDEYSPQMEDFWQYTLLKDGDVARYVKGSNEFSQIRFAFACASRAYDIVSRQSDTTEDYADLKQALVKLLEELHDIAPESLIYQRHE